MWERTVSGESTNSVAIAALPARAAAPTASIDRTSATSTARWAAVTTGGAEPVIVFVGSTAADAPARYTSVRVPDPHGRAVGQAPAPVEARPVDPRAVAREPAVLGDPAVAEA